MKYLPTLCLQVLACAGLTACQQVDGMYRYPACELRSTATLSPDEAGPQGFSGEELLTAALLVVGSFEVSWDAARGDLPAPDTFTTRFEAPTVTAFEQECGGQPSAYLQVDADARITNADQTVSAVGRASIVSPELTRHGAYVFFDSPADIGGAYADLVPPPAANAMTLSLRPARTTRSTPLSRVAVDDAWPRTHELFLERPADRADSSGRSALLLCTSPDDCFVPAN